MGNYPVIIDKINKNPLYKLIPINSFIKSIKNKIFKINNKNKIIFIIDIRESLRNNVKFKV